MLNNEYPPLGGGQARACKNVFDTFNTNYSDIQIDIVTASTNQTFTENYKTGNIYYLDIRKSNKNIQHQSIKDLILFSIKAFCKTSKIIRQQKYDLIVAWSGVPAGYVAFLIKLFYKSQYIILLRGSDVPYHEAKWKWLDKFIFSWLTPIIWLNAIAISANSSELKIKAQKLISQKEITVITNGVDTNYFCRKKEISKIDKKRIILGVGRLSKIKGYDLLISTLVEEVLQNKNVEVWLVGDGQEFSTLKQQAENLKVSDKVKFWGSKSKDELLQIYNQADMFCLPSRNEGMSNALLEAMACGLPVVATNVGGVAELIDGNGIIVEKENVEKLAIAISEILISNDFEKFANQSRKIAENFSWTNITNQFYQLFKSNLK